MKLSKWLTPILTSTLAIAGGSVGLVGCGEQPTPPTPPSPPSPAEIEQFISDRTFSLMAYSIISDQDPPQPQYYGAFCYGTGWIIDDATPSITNDYKYHVATNWHVTNGFHDLETEDYSGRTYYFTVFNYADSSCATDPNGIIDSIDEYTSLGASQIGKTSYYQEESDPHTFMVEPYEQNRGIDLYEIDIDFASDSGQVGSQAMKQKLDTLNTYRSTHGYINKFVCGDDEEIQNKTKYIGGYPMKEDPVDPLLFGGKWETHEVNSELHYVSSHSHSVGSSNVIDVSPQYESNLDMGTDWMTGGSSGSMLLTEDCEICGIYWGGWGNEVGTTFYPSFSLFNTTSKNFLAKYIHN